MSLQGYVDWLRDGALPRWLVEAADRDGLFWETLDFDGKPRAEAELRLRTGMRQVYCFAHAATLGLAEPGPATALAVRMMDRLRAMAWSPDREPGWVARFDRDGRVLDARRDLYDHAFVLNALGHLHQATGDARYLAWIDEALHIIDTGMAGWHGGWAENTHGELPRRQNPHMHFFEANLALYETTGEARHLARAGELFGLFRSRFLDQETGTLREFFGPEWQIGAEYGSERLDPGHMMEWTWLLRRFERATGRDVEALCANLLETGLRIGLRDGFLVDEADHAGAPLLDRSRLWPQTEFLKALVVQGKATARPDLLDEAGGLATRMLDRYLGGVPAGLWRDQFDLDGRPTASSVPASTLYHLVAPAAEILHYGLAH